MHNYATKYIGKEVEVVIDRPLHSRHPKHGFEYKLNYGYVPDTTAPDGEEIDAYVLGINESIETFIGICIAVIHRTNDSDDKLIAVLDEQKNITDGEIRSATHFQEQFFKSEIIR
jgi:inorganic pyrophosphatase